MFNLVNWYKFNVNGKVALVPAKSLFGAFMTLENEGYTNYSYIGMA